MKNIYVILPVALFIGLSNFMLAQSNSFMLHDSLYFEKTGADVLVYNNWYNGNFSDSKISGIEIIHHGVRVATNGDVRLEPTPEQWDEIPAFIGREEKAGTITAYSQYPDYDFSFDVSAKPSSEGILLSIHLDNPLPKELEGKAAFHLEFLPATYREKTFFMDEKSGSFPLYPSGPTEYSENGDHIPLPIGSGQSIHLAPEDSMHRISVLSKSGEMQLYDGRNEAQNGWYVLREIIPSNKTGNVIEWQLNIHAKENWVREPVIGHSQVGYHPDQQKVAIIELDKNDDPNDALKVIRIHTDGREEMVYSEVPSLWGDWLRYQYVKGNFSTIKQPGIYLLEYDGTRSFPFRIDSDIYENAWHPTLDVFFPVQMDHMLVNEAYRVWHGAAHLDDALQAPVDHEHFDLYRQGETTDTKYLPGAHIPGLNIGGWFDAGDYDIRTQTQYGAVLGLVDTWETFEPTRDETTVEQQRRYVDLHQPDGKADILQQIEHGVLGLVAQYRAFDRAINGIIVPDISQYTHLGDGLTMTDGLIFDSSKSADESDGLSSGISDDRWAFTSRSSSVNFGAMVALAASSRALKNYNQELSNECLQKAEKAWADEAENGPFNFRHGNTTGGNPLDEKFKAATELLKSTKKEVYRKAVMDLLPEIKERNQFNLQRIVQIIPLMDEGYQNEIQPLILEYKKYLDALEEQNPYGVPISMGGWAGSGWVLRFTTTNYILHKYYPEIVIKEDVFRGLHYLHGLHPGSSISLVSGVGVHSKKVAYGMNRADYSFIAGGIVPGVLILKPNFPENKEDWPFLWGENEYVISLGAPYIYSILGANSLLK